VGGGGGVAEGVKIEQDLELESVELNKKIRENAEQRKSERMRGKAYASEGRLRKCYNARETTRALGKLLWSV
jgi:hypothetical protein